MKHSVVNRALIVIGPAKAAGAAGSGRRRRGKSRGPGLPGGRNPKTLRRGTRGPRWLAHVLGSILLSLSLSLPGHNGTAAAAGNASTRPRTGWFESSLPDFSPYADQGEIARRMFHLSVSRQLFAYAESLGQELRGQSVDPRDENFHIFVPEDYDPDRPYGLFVWVSAREKVTVPKKWATVFSDHDLIFIAVDEAGNRTNDLDRRVPLALHGVANMQARYHIDPERIYVAGLSGGGRVASKIAAGYGDLFTGGYFIVGSDPMGSKTVPVPDSATLGLMQTRGRYVFLTGRKDTPTITATRTALASYQRLCVTRSILQFPNMGHGLPNIFWFRRAIEYLESGYRSEPLGGAELAACRAELEGQVRGRTAEIEQLIDRSETEQAKERLKDLQLDFGRLAEAEFSRLYARLGDASDGTD